MRELDIIIKEIKAISMLFSWTEIQQMGLEIDIEKSITSLVFDKELEM